MKTNNSPTGNATGKSHTKRRAPVLLVTLTIVVAGIFSLGVFTVFGTPALSGSGPDLESEIPRAGAGVEDETARRPTTSSLLEPAMDSTAQSAARPAIAFDIQPLEGPDGLVYVLTLGVMSRGDDPIALQFTSGQMYDFVVSQDDREVWRWSMGKAFHQALQRHTLDPGALHTFVELWDGRDAEGERILGSVTVEASVKATTALEAEPTTLTIE